MHHLPEARIRMLRHCFERSLSVRKAAIESGCNRNTANTYFRKFRSGQIAVESSVSPECSIRATVARSIGEILDAEAIERGLTTAELCAEILENVAKDGLFNAVIDE